MIMPHQQSLVGRRAGLKTPRRGIIPDAA